jgi:ketopantoate reductase
MESLFEKPAVYVQLLILASLLFFSSCRKDRLSGSGHVVTEERSVAGFNNVEVNGSMKVHVSEGTGQQVRVEAEDNIISRLETYVSNNTLIVKFKNGWTIIPHRTVHVYVSTDVYHGLVLNGSGGIDCGNNLNTDHLRLTVNGSGDMTVRTTANSIDGKVEGSGDINLSGSATDLKSEVNGSGDFNALQLQTNTADVYINGSGEQTVWVEQTLNARINGSGTVKYTGNAAVNTNINGSGKVKKI